MAKTRKIVRINGEEIHEPIGEEPLRNHLGHKERTDAELTIVQEKLYNAVSTAPSDTEEEYLMRVSQYADDLKIKHYPDAMRYQRLELIRVMNIINTEFPGWVPLPEPNTEGLWLPNG